MSHPAGAVFLRNSISRRMKLFCWRGVSSCRDFFSYSPVFGRDIGYLPSVYAKNINF